jgi:hypothetical protein
MLSIPRTQCQKRPSTTREPPATEPTACHHPTHTAACPAVETQLLRNFGLTDTVELDTIGAFICHSVKWGSEPLVQGFANMFKGMKTAVEVYEQMKIEIHSLHAGVLAMTTEMNDLKDQHAAAEALAAHAAEVSYARPLHAPRALTVSHRTATDPPSPTTTRR